MIFGPLKTNSGLKRADFGPKKAGFGCERANFGSERGDFRSERVDLGLLRLISDLKEPDLGIREGCTDGL